VVGKVRDFEFGGVRLMKPNQLIGHVELSDPVAKGVDWHEASLSPVYPPCNLDPAVCRHPDGSTSQSACAPVGWMET